MLLKFDEVNVAKALADLLMTGTEKLLPKIHELFNILGCFIFVVFKGEFKSTVQLH